MTKLPEKLQERIKELSDEYQNYHTLKPQYDACKHGAAAIAEELYAHIEELRGVLEFYRNEYNWLKGSEEACSPIIADTGAKAKQALKQSQEKYGGGDE